MQIFIDIIVRVLVLVGLVAALVLWRSGRRFFTGWKLVRLWAVAVPLQFVSPRWLLAGVRGQELLARQVLLCAAVVGVVLCLWNIRRMGVGYGLVGSLLEVLLMGLGLLGETGLGALVVVSVVLMVGRPRGMRASARRALPPPNGGPPLHPSAMPVGFGLPWLPDPDFKAFRADTWPP